MNVSRVLKTGLWAVLAAGILLLGFVAWALWYYRPTFERVSQDVPKRWNCWILDNQEAIAGIRQGYQDVKAGRTKPADQFLEGLRRKHDLPR
jgi:predicted PurR-regulated permease PerM